MGIALPFRAAALAIALATWPAQRSFAEDAPLYGSDYTVTEVAGRYVTPPSSATRLDLGIDDTERIDLPFVFLHFGNAYDEIHIQSNGNTQFSPTFGGQGRAKNTLFPKIQSLGWICPLMDSLNPIDQGGVKYWTDGEAPRRRFLVTWENVGVGTQTYAGSVSFQIQIFEGTNVVVFAYAPDSVPSTWVALSASIGMSPNGHSVLEMRYVAPFGNSVDLAGHPESDLRFDPIPVAITGTVVYDRDVANGDGVGNSTATDEPLRGVRVVARQEDGLEIGSTLTGADGDWEIEVPARLSRDPYVFVQAVNDACVVERDSDGNVFEHAAGTASDVWATVDIGTTHLDTTITDQARLRAAMHVAAALDLARTATVPNVDVAVPPVLVRFVTGNSSATSYAPAGDGSVRMVRVADGGTPNPDLWDRGPVILAYSRYVLDLLSALPTTSRRVSFDSVTSASDAFPEAFGYYLFAAATGESEFVDTVDATTATTLDLEDPQPSTRAGPDVTAWVAAALHDLVDADNEGRDRIDGTGGAHGGLLRVVEEIAAPTDAVGVHEAWGGARADATELTRLFAVHGLIEDDDSEPNDDVAEAAAVGDAPLLTIDRTLALYAEDWYEFELPSDVPELRAQMDFNRVGLDTNVDFELRDVADQILATGAAADRTRPLTLQSGALFAGTYRLRVAWRAGVSVGAYSVQVYEPLEMSALSVVEWTEGRPYRATVGSRGGVPPLVLEAVPFGSEPPGLHFVGASRLEGVPSKAGEYDLWQIVRDAGAPQHTRTVRQLVTINPPLRVEFGAFIGLPLGRAFEVSRAEPGGTAPRAFTVTGGALPPGMTLDVDALRLHGTPATPSASPFTVHGSDVAGSTDEVTTTCVVCPPAQRRRTPLQLGADAAAAGVYVDALQGATLRFATKTAKRSPRRILTPVLLGPDARSVPLRKVKAKNGKASAMSEALPVSGRYFCLFAAAGGAATELSVTIKTKLGKKGGDVFAGAAEAVLRTVEIGGLTGSRLTLTVQPARRSEVDVSIVAVLRPDGTAVPLSGLITEKGSKVLLRTTLDAAGTWSITIRAAPGPGGDVSWKYKLKHPKGAVFSTD